MGVFKSLFGSKKEQRELNWKVLSESSQLDNAIQISNEKPVVIFKHSTRCGISRMVLNQFQNNADFNEDDVLLLYLDLIAYRAVSDEIAHRLGVLHQSPQLIILKNENVAFHASHYQAVPSAVNRVLEM
jgi:bacillithiol system protein YtxJ